MRYALEVDGLLAKAKEIVAGIEEIGSPYRNRDSVPKTDDGYDVHSYFAAKHEAESLVAWLEGLLIAAGGGPLLEARKGQEEKAVEVNTMPFPY